MLQAVNRILVLLVETKGALHCLQHMLTYADVC
jgi:hypothetical protein